MSLLFYKSVDFGGTGHSYEPLTEVHIIITKKLIEAGKLFDMAVLDHLIIEDGYYSFADNEMV
jgi:DNA repair protein RadC